MAVAVKDVLQLSGSHDCLLGLYANCAGTVVPRSESLDSPHLLKYKGNHHLSNVTDPKGIIEGEEEAGTDERIQKGNG